MKMTEKRLFYILVALLAITTIIDLGTAFSSPVFTIAESNPFFVLTGNAILFTVFAVFISVHLLRKVNNTISALAIFGHVLATIYVSVAHLLGAVTNIISTMNYNKNPEKALELYGSYTSFDKIISYLLIVGLVMVLPIMISIISFKVSSYIYEKRKPKREAVIKDVVKHAKEIGKLSEKILTD